MGSEGSAILYVHPESMSKLKFERRNGWMSFIDGEQFLFGKPNLLRYDLKARKKPSIVEMGMSNSMGFASLEAGITCHLHLGMDRIAHHIQILHNRLEEGLTDLGFKSMRTRYKEGRSSVLGMLPPDGYDTPTIFQEMISNKIAISQPDGYLRFAPSWLYLSSSLVSNTARVDCNSANWIASSPVVAMFWGPNELAVENDY